MSTKPPRLLLCITFHFSSLRLTYLKRIASEFESLAESVKTVVITNDPRAHELIKAELNPLGLELEILSPTLLGHPYLLAWCHKEIFRRELERKRNEFSHYLYAEDDLLISEHNMNYWMEARDRLKPSGLIPSFIRYEINHSMQQKVSADMAVKVDPAKAAKIFFPKINYAYIALPNPYQGTYLFDCELLAEHFGSCFSYGPEAPAPHGWIWTRERAALGATFYKVPYGFSSRNVAGYDLDSQCVDERCLIRHLPNNYTDNPACEIGNLAISDLISPPMTLPRARKRRHTQLDGSFVQLPRRSLQEYAQSISKLAKNWLQK
jgi:hypothetical protein